MVKPILYFNNDIYHYILGKKMRKNSLITENEKKQILQLHNSDINNTNDIVIIEWLSPKDDFVIFLDELIDVKNKISLGNIWENFDNFKFFLKHSFETSKNVPSTIKESVLDSINNLLITESTQDYTMLKPFVKQFINEEGFGDWVGKQGSKIGNWVKEKGVEAYQGTKDFVKKSAKGVYDFGKNIAKGDFAAAFSIIKKGVLYVARKVRAAMYHPVGMVLDAILIATGIGKSVQWIPWAIVVALDIYEVATGNFENPNEPVWMKVLFILCDILGLVFAGGVALATRKSVQALTTGTKELAVAGEMISKSSTLKSALKSSGDALKKLPDLIKKAIKFLKGKSPSIGGWIEGIAKSLSSFIQKISGWLTKLGESGAKATQGLTTSQKLSAGAKSGVKTAATVTGLDYGFKKGMQIYQGKSDQDVENEEQLKQSIANLSPEEIKTMNTGMDKYFS